MCEVCAVFGIGRHWSEGGARADARRPSPDIVRHRMERRRGIALLNRLLRDAGLRLRDWDGEAYWIERADGRGERVADLNALWRVAEKLAGRPIDPLTDAAFAAPSPDAGASPIVDIPAGTPVREAAR